MNDAPPDLPLAKIPRWQVVLLLVGFPLLYLANSFMPWSFRLFAHHDRAWYLAFGVSLLVLHWLSVIVALVAVKRAGAPLAELGFRWQFTQTSLFVAIVIATGALLVWLSTTWEAGQPPQESWQMLYPFTLVERVFWIAVSLSAGFCEEFVYRGFAIRVLQARGWKTWQAVGLATLSFVFIHGVAALFGFPFYFLAGLIFAAIFLWRKSLAPGMYLHALFDLMAILAL